MEFAVEGTRIPISAPALIEQIEASAAGGSFPIPARTMIPTRQTPQTAPSIATTKRKTLTFILPPIVEV